MAKVTLKDIAREVGLSPTAVSLVLNDRPCKISAESRARIKEVARKKRYIPNQIARSLVTQHSQTLGLIVPNIESRFFSSLARALEVACRKRGYLLLITNSDDSSHNDADLVRLLVNRGVDGLFIVVADELRYASGLKSILEQLPVPYVMVDRFIEGLDCDRVGFNNEQGGYPADISYRDEPDALLYQILTCADCIDAATDSVGRAYSRGKTFEEMLANLRQNSGRMFNPELVALFDDAALCEKVERLLLDERGRMYDRVFTRAS